MSPRCPAIPPTSAARHIQETTAQRKTPSPVCAIHPFQLNIPSNPLDLLFAGLIIHPPSLSQTTETPIYSLVRLSATHENDGWYQTNLPLPPNPEDGVVGPKWAEEINHIVEHQLPRALAHRLANDLGSVRSDAGSDDGDNGGDEDEDERSEFDPNDAMAGIDTEDQVHVNRVRIWGMTASPGGGVTAVFITQYGTMWPGRDTFAGHKCRVLFGRYDSNADENEDANTTLAMKKLSTEARAWEWMYGGGPPVAGVGAGISTPAQERNKQIALKDHFAMVSRSQVCSFCELPLEPVDKSSRCQRGHIFGKHSESCLMLLHISDLHSRYLRYYRAPYPSSRAIEDVQCVRVQVPQAGRPHCYGAATQGDYYGGDLRGILRRLRWEVY